MPADSALAEHLKEQLAPLGQISIRRMFGAAGVFVDGLMFGMIAGEALFLKADGQTQGDFEAEGRPQISYGKMGKTIPMAFWQAPERLLDDDDEMQAWAARAIAAARRMQSPKLKRQATPASTARHRNRTPGSRR